MVRAMGIAAAAVLVVLPACGSGQVEGTGSTTSTAASGTSTTGLASTTAAPGTAPPPGEIDIVDFEFSPRELTVARGETVTWRNQDPYDHWVVSTQPDVLDSGEMSQAQTYTKTFSQAGNYTYYCNIHNYMKATVTVR